MTKNTLSTKSDTVTENALAQQVRMGDPASCAALIAHFGGPLYHYLYWLTGSSGDALAHFKDTVLYLYLNPGRVRKERSLRHGLFRHATQTWLQGRTQRLRQRRSSLDKILRGGLAESKEIPWADWLSQCTGVDAEQAAMVEPVVDGLETLTDQERAALLMATVGGLPIDVVAASLRLSPRKARGLLLSAFHRISTVKSGFVDGVSRKARMQAYRHVLGLESARQARGFEKNLDAHPEYRPLAEDGAALMAVLRALPQAPPPGRLQADTTAHLAAGHAALETRIATWGFRFMQVTLPLFILAILTVILLPAISRSREMARRAAATENLQTLGKALRAYSDASPGKRYPPLTSIEGLWVPDLERLYPNYIGDPSVLVSPSLNDPSVIAAMNEALKKTPPDWPAAQKILAQSYVYTGYTLLDAASLEAFMAFRSSQPDLDLEGDLETDDRRFYRLRQGVEQFFVGTTNVKSEQGAAAAVKIPIMFEVFAETGFGGNPEGANVLYLDGTVEYVPFGSAFPVDAAVMALLENSGKRR